MRAFDKGARMNRIAASLLLLFAVGISPEPPAQDSIATLRQLTEDQNINETVRQRAQKGLAELE